MSSELRAPRAVLPDDLPDDLAISVRGLGKRYRIARAQERQRTFAEALSDRLRRPFGRAAREELWALADVDLDVHRGEVLGLIGANGAGKSTLLKILSRITRPSRGEALLRGRVGSLLEVGTGFHRELTGRENVFLNGCILGMTRREIAARFDAIVDFAGVSRFLDTPVKRYSSGMYVRLAFAVAAHLEPEILIVDEVLAVGDVEFQRRCLGKMGEVARGGRTVLFVSHNLAAVRSLCTRACVLEAGRIVATGTPDACVNAYLARGAPEGGGGRVVFERPVERGPHMVEARLLGAGGPVERIEMGDALSLEVDFESDEPVQPALGLVIQNADGVKIVHVSTRYAHEPELLEPRKRGTLRFELGAVPFTPGAHQAHLYFGDRTHDTHVVEGALAFEVSPKDLWGAGRAYEARHSALWWPARVTLLETADVEVE